MARDLNTRLSAILERHPMTTAREKAEAFAASCLYGADNSDAITHAARQLLAIVDQRFAELREKEKEGCQTQQQTQSRPQSVSSECASSSPQSSAPATAASETDWRPSSTDVENALATVTNIGHRGSTYSAHQYIRSGLILGHRIARENQCSNTSSAVSSPRVSFSSATTSTEAERTAVATKPDAPTESGTPSPKSEASSLDERAEALFAANPGWRPRSNDQSLSLQFHEGRWTWLSINWFSVDPSPATANAHLLAALLPRAIDKWTANGREVSTGIFVRCNGNPPHDLESAIRVLEGK